MNFDEWDEKELINLRATLAQEVCDLDNEMYKFQKKVRKLKLEIREKNEQIDYINDELRNLKPKKERPVFKCVVCKDTGLVIDNKSGEPRPCVLCRKNIPKADNLAETRLPQE